MDINQSSRQAWYLVYCKPRQEQTAKANLERQGYEVFLPLMKAKKRVQGKTCFRLEAMFPRYMFIRLTQGVDNWAPIRSTIGVSHLVRFGLELANVPNELINTLQQCSSAAGVLEIEHRGIKAGDHCRVTDGVMEGYEAIVLARSGKERVKLMLNSIDFSFEMPEDQLELVS